MMKLVVLVFMFLIMDVFGIFLLKLRCIFLLFKMVKVLVFVNMGKVVSRSVSRMWCSFIFG